MNDYEEERRKQIAIRRSIVDYSMGVFFLVLGLLFLLHDALGFDFGNRLPGLDMFFGTMSVIYGGWRIYRGYKKNYFK